MKKLLQRLAYFTLFFSVIFELFLNLLGLASDRLTQELNSDGFVIFTPLQEGYRTRGMRKEVNARYRINKQGWNSAIDYDSVTNNTIAIIGDSFIANFWNDVDLSVGRQLEEILSEKGIDVVVYEYGKPGENFYDYTAIAEYLSAKGYNRIFTYFGVKDLKAPRPSISGKKKFKDMSTLKSIYTRSATLRYLNINLDIKNILKGKSDLHPLTPDLSTIEEFENRALPYVVYFYEDDLFDEVKNPKINLVKIRHLKFPIDHGFNGHWNANANWNVANTLADYILKVTDI